MSRNGNVAERDLQAQELRAQGLTYREVGERMGETKKQAWRRCNREHVQAYERTRSDQKREHERKHRALCPECGTPMQMGSKSPSRRPARCRDCEVERKAAETGKRGWQIVEWWAEGLTRREIADRLGWTVTHVSVEMLRLREQGYPLPYRYELKRPKFPELGKGGRPL